MLDLLALIEPFVMFEINVYLCALFAQTYKVEVYETYQVKSPIPNIAKVWVVTKNKIKTIFLITPYFQYFQNGY